MTDIEPATVDDSEEPLFADDLDDFLDEDVPPLPPPLPPISTQAPPTTSQPPTTQDNRDGGQSSSTQRRKRPTAEGTDGEEPPTKVRKPMLKFTVEMLFNDKGIPYIMENFPKLRFKGKGHEASDLKYLLKKYELWANSLFPKLTFHDFIQRVEKLGTTKEYKASLERLRRKASGRDVDDLVNDENEAPEEEGHGTAGDGNDGDDAMGNGDNGDNANGTSANDTDEFPSLWDVVEDRTEQGTQEDDPYEDIAEDFDF